MNELLLPFAVYQRHDEEDHYLLKEVYIHKVRINVRGKMPSKHEVFNDNSKLCSNIASCWIALFVNRDKCFTLTSQNHSSELVWLKKDYVMRFNPSLTRRTFDYITNKVDLVVPLSSRLDCYCPHSHDLVSTTLLFSNYITYPMKISSEHFRPYLKVFADYWRKIMRETIEKNKIFLLPPLLQDNPPDCNSLLKVTDTAGHLSMNKSSLVKDTRNSNTSLDHIIGSIKNEQSKVYARMPKKPRTLRQP